MKYLQVEKRSKIFFTLNFLLRLSPRSICFSEQGKGFISPGPSRWPNSKVLLRPRLPPSIGPDFFPCLPLCLAFDAKGQVSSPAFPLAQAFDATKGQVSFPALLWPGLLPSLGPSLLPAESASHDTSAQRLCKFNSG